MAACGLAVAIHLPALRIKDPSDRAINNITDLMEDTESQQCVCTEVITVIKTYGECTYHQGVGKHEVHD